MVKIFNDFTEGAVRTIEYTVDGESVSHRVQMIVQTESVEIIPGNIEPTLEDKINYIYYKNMGVI